MASPNTSDNTPRASAGRARAVGAVEGSSLWPIAGFALSFIALLGLLFWLVWRNERAETQSEIERDINAAAYALHEAVAENARSLAAFGERSLAERADAPALARELLDKSRELVAIEWRDAAGKRIDGVVSLGTGTLRTEFSRESLPATSKQTFERALANRSVEYAPSRYVPQPDFQSIEVIEFWVPVLDGERVVRMVRSVINLKGLLVHRLPEGFSLRYATAITEPDGSTLALHSSVGSGGGNYRAQSLLDLKGVVLVLRARSPKDLPGLVPNALSAFVAALSIALFVSFVMLALDMRRRRRAERELLSQLSFRAAMEDSLVTGLRARDLEGRITYVNPAFCRIVGYSAPELVGSVPPMPYWAPESIGEITPRFAQVLAGSVSPEGFTTTFMRKDGTRVPVLIFEAPLVDERGRRTGWLSSVLDLTEQRRVESLNQRQQESLQASARLAAMGEVATTLSHELNQPLAAIASFAAGSVNMIERGGDVAQELKPVQAAILAQAERAGEVIRSVHRFVRQREPSFTRVRAEEVIARIRPLMQLRASAAQVALEISLAPSVKTIEIDLVMIELVLLNLARNGIDAMSDTPSDQRRLTIEARMSDDSAQGQTVLWRVGDRGPGVSPEADAQLFAPFYSTKPEGMGMGLNICRTIIEQHQGRIWHEPREGGGAWFCFTVRAPGAVETPSETEALGAAL